MPLAGDELAPQARHAEAQSIEVRRRVGFGTASSERSEEVRFPRPTWGANPRRSRGIGSSGRIRTYNPPVNRLMQVVYLVGSSCL